MGFLIELGKALLWIGTTLALVWVWQRWYPSRHPTRRADDGIILAAVSYGMAQSGVNVTLALVDDADLISTGKFDEVLHHASQQLGQSVRTVGDLKDLLVNLRD